MIMGLYKESVELNSVYPNEGCGKTHAKINDTIPHTVVDMGFKAQNVPILKYLHEVSVVPYRPLALKTTTFSLEDLRKNTFTICNVRWLKPNDFTNVGRIFRINNTHGVSCLSEMLIIML